VNILDYLEEEVPDDIENLQTKKNTTKNAIVEYLGYQIPVTQQNRDQERYSRVPRLSDIRYSAEGTKGKWQIPVTQLKGPQGNGDMQAYLDYQIPVTLLNRVMQNKARLKCATYRR